jgi:hypothetical protein
MKEVIYGRMPTPRGAYLFTWGTVYLLLGYILLHSTRYIIWMSWLFGVTGLVAIVAGFWHRLDRWAFTGLASAAGGMGFAVSFIRPHDIRSLNTGLAIIWFGVAVAQVVVARWPVPTPPDGGKYQRGN